MYVYTYLPTNALGPIPLDVAVSPNGCQSLQVTWTPLTVTSPLSLNHYRVRYRAHSYQTQGGSQQTYCYHNISGFLYTHLLLPQRTQSEWAHKPNLDMGLAAVYPQPQHTMVRH